MKSKHIIGGLIGLFVLVFFVWVSGHDIPTERGYYLAGYIIFCGLFIALGVTFSEIINPTKDTE
jgi:hypothetical protein